MKGKARIVVVAAAALALVALVAAGVLLADRDGGDGALGGAAAGERVEAGPPAPELSGTDPVTGKRVSLRDFAGKPVVINVWASWCPGCNEEAVALRRLAEAHPEAVVLGLDTQDTIGEAKGFYRKWGWKHASISDPNGELAARLGLRGLPETIFLDEKHRVVTRIVGAATFSQFEASLEQAKRAS